MPRRTTRRPARPAARGRVAIRSCASGCAPSGRDRDHRPGVRVRRVRRGHPAAARLDWPQRRLARPAADRRRRALPRGARPMTTESQPRSRSPTRPCAPTTRSSRPPYEAGLETAKARPRRSTTATSSTARSATATATFEVRSPIDSDILVGTFAKGTRAGRPGRDRGRAPGAAGLVPARLGEAARDPASRAAELISERQMEYARPDGDRGRQDPARGARRGRGGGRPDPLLREDGRGQRVLRPPDGQPRRRGGPHPVDPPAARRVRGDQPVQLPDGARRRPVGGGDDGRQHGRVQAGHRRRR